MPEHYLASRRHPGVTARQAVDLLDDPAAVGFVYTPRHAFFVANGPDGWCRCTDSTPASVDLDAVFELTVFTADREVRWTQTGGGNGTAVLVYEDTADAGPYRLVETAQLLWGQVNAGRGRTGWVSTESARIGHLMVPFAGAVEDGGYLALTGIEYAERDKHGNVTVVDFRHTGIRVHGTPVHPKQEAAQ